MIGRLHTTHLLVRAEPRRGRKVDRAIRRLEAFKLKLVAAADSAGVPQGRRVHRCRRLARQGDHRVPYGRSPRGRTGDRPALGHDATATALDAGLVSPGHASVIVRATGQLPAAVSQEQRQVVEADLVAKAARFTPDQLRRIARRAIEAVEPDQTSSTPTKMRSSAPRSKPPGRSAH